MTTHRTPLTTHLSAHRSTPAAAVPARSLPSKVLPWRRLRHTVAHMRSAVLLLTTSLALFAPAVAASDPAKNMAWAIGQPLTLEGKTLEGQRFSLAQLHGRLVLVVMWHTACGVCLDKMPELRANVAGWKSQAFSLVSVQLDPDLQSPTLYWDAVRRLQPSARNMPVLWHGDASYRDNLAVPANAAMSTLPWSFLVDRNGKVIAAYQGRIPADAWDLVAEHLP